MRTPSTSTIAAGIISALLQSITTIMALASATEQQPCSASTTPSLPHPNQLFNSQLQEQSHVEPNKPRLEYKTNKGDEQDAGDDVGYAVTQDHEKQKQNRHFSLAFDCQDLGNYPYQYDHHHSYYLYPPSAGESSRPSSRRSSIISPTAPLTTSPPMLHTKPPLDALLPFRSHFYGLDALCTNVLSKYSNRRGGARAGSGLMVRYFKSRSDRIRTLPRRSVLLTAPLLS